MPEIINLADKIKQLLPPELVNFMRVASDVAVSQEQNLYLVGGVVRDLLLERTNIDLDLVVEDNAIKLAQQLVRINQSKITTHPRFGTAKLRWNKWSVDLATARSETYTKSGALPTVKPSSLHNDLSRRDFTINTMAINLNPGHYGELIDPCKGKKDLEHKLIRVLHEKSFTDDASRIWRGLRYEQRLGFQLETTTLLLLKRDIPMLETISGDRIRHELKLVLKEKKPEKVLHRAQELNILQKLHPSLKGDGWLAEKFEQARQLNSANVPLTDIYLALLAYPLTNEDNEHLILRCRLPKSLAQILRDTNSIKGKLQSLSQPKLTPSSIYYLLHGYSLSAIAASLLASDSAVTSQHIHSYLDKLHYVKSVLSGDDLKRMGVTTGPHIREILHQLHIARLNGEINTKQGEVKLLHAWLPHRRR